MYSTIYICVQGLGPSIAEVFLTGEFADKASAGDLPSMDRYGKKKLAVLT